MIFGNIFGSSSESKSSEQSQQAQDVLSASKQTQNRNQVSSTVAQQKGRTETSGKTTTHTRLRRLDEETIEFLKGTLGEAGRRDIRVEDLFTSAAGAAESGISLADFLIERAKGTQEFVDERSDAIIASERLTGEREIRGSTRAAAEAAGGGLNTLVSAQNQRATEDLAVRLAGLRGQLDLSGRQLESADLAAGAGVLQGATAGAAGVAGGISSAQSSEAANIAIIANVLKGAFETGASETDFSSVVNQLIESGQTTGLTEALTTILQGGQSGTSSGSGTSSSSGSTSEGIGSTLLKSLPLFLPGG